MDSHGGKNFFLRMEGGSLVLFLSTPLPWSGLKHSPYSHPCSLPYVSKVQVHARDAREITTTVIKTAQVWEQRTRAQFLAPTSAVLSHFLTPALEHPMLSHTCLHPTDTQIYRI